MTSFTPTIRAYLFFLVVLSMASCEINGEHDDCYDGCQFGEVEVSYESTQLYPYYNNGDESFSDLPDSICPCDFRIDIDFMYNEVIIEDKKGDSECCGYNYFSLDTIESVNLFAINTETEDTTNVSEHFQLNYPRDDQTLAEFDEYAFYTWIHLDSQLTPHEDIPLSTIFYTEVKLKSGRLLTDHTDVILFKK